MSLTAKIDRKVVVVSSWTVFGLLGLGFLLEGGARESLLIGIIGMVAIAAGFTCHLIANYVFEQSFTKGEIALGLGVFTAATIVFILNWLTGGVSETSFLIGFATLLLIVVGFFIYLTTRYGVGGAFKKFDVASKTQSRDQK